MSNCCNLTEGSAVASCCGMYPDFVSGVMITPIGNIRSVSHDWTWKDRCGALAMRLGISRMSYSVMPGIYASGKPSADSPVFVTANYKLTIDHVRRAIKGIDAWLLVLNTGGINVWCAAGKGTFGTAELVDRIRSTRLAELVTHRTLIVPQLGATGVAAHEVWAESGFNVIYGPIRVNDLPDFLNNGMKASPEMRTVTFNVAERLAVVPVEVVHWSKWLVVAFAVCALAATAGSGDFSLKNWWMSAMKALFAFISGVGIGPLLFPWLPGRAFAVKGLFSGFLTAVVMCSFGLFPFGNMTETLQSIGWLLITLSISSFLMLMYTGSSPYTSLSGTRIETRIGFRLQGVSAISGILLLLAPLLTWR